MIRLHRDVGLQLIENKVLSWGIIGKSAPILAEITIRKSQELSIELPSQGARRATDEGSKHGWQKPQRFSARQKTEVVLRLLRGELLDLVSRELGIPAARLTTWREAFLDAGQEALKKPPLDSHDRELCGLTGFMADRRLIIWRQTLETLSDYIQR